MSLETMAESSTRYARETTRAEWIWRVVAIGLMGLFLAIPIRAIADEQTPETTIEFDIPQQRADLALTQFAEQANLTLLFPFEGVRDRTANALTGEYTLDEAIEVLLAGTGLTPTFKNALVLDIAIDSDSTVDEDGMNTKKKAGLVAVLAGVLAGGVSAQEVTGAEQESQSSAVTGRVTDARTGANLKGAKVTIEETGQWTSTGDLGRFRFANVPAGEYTLRVSFLGYAEQSAIIAVLDGLPITESFALRGGDDIEEIIVFGTRSARALALNQERTAENFTTVVSSDLLGNFTGTTISEALRRAPGIAFEQEFSTGDGTNIIIRGSAPDLNTVKFNGVELPEVSGEGRSASLNTVLADSIDSVTISKTLLPNQDSAGIGGLVEIETKSPLDRPQRFAQFSFDDRQRQDDFLDDYVASAQLSGTFGQSDSLGIGVSAQVREREVRSVVSGVPSFQFGAFLPLDSQGGTAVRRESDVTGAGDFPFSDAYGADFVFPTGLRAGEQSTDTQTVSIGVNAAWDVNDSTIFRFDYQYLEDERTFFSTDYNLSAAPFYSARPVAALDGEVRAALQISDTFTPRISHSANASDDEVRQTEVFSFRGDTSVSAWDFGYSLGYTEGSTEVPQQLALRGDSLSSLIGWDPSFIDPSAVDPVEGIVLGLFRPVSPEDTSILVPLFTEDGFAVLNDPAAVRFGDGQLTNTAGFNERIGAELSGRYNFDNEYLRYVEVGLHFEESEFSGRSSRASFSSNPSRAPLSTLGIAFDTPVLRGVRRDLGLFTFSPNTVTGIYNNLDALAEAGVYSVNEIIPGDRDVNVTATETEYAPYIQARFEIGDWEIVGGARYTIFEVEADDLDFPRFFAGDPPVADLEFQERNTVFRTETARQEELLPRMLVNYRPQDNLVVRGGYFKSIARPQLSLISDTRNFTLVEAPRFGPDRNLPQIIIQEGNEDIDPAETHNFDLSVEYYDDNAGVLKASLFYKSISNLTEQNIVEGTQSLDGVTLPPFPTELDILALAEQGQIFVSRRRPTNNPDDAEIWGIELVAERQFVNLPGMWSGLGFFANYTYTDSSKTQPVDFFDPALRETVEEVFDDVRFNGQPEHSGTIAVTYNEFGVDSALIYSTQDRRQRGTFVRNGLSPFDEAFDSLDFRFAYTLDNFGGRYQLVFEATDLLRDTDDPNVITGQGESAAYYDRQSFLGGRELRFGFVVTFSN